MIASSFQSRMKMLMAVWHGNHADRRALDEVIAEEFTPRLAEVDWTPAPGYPLMLTVCLPVPALSPSQCLQDCLSG